MSLVELQLLFSKSSAHFWCSCLPKQS